MTMTAIGIAPKVLASSIVGSAVGMVLGSGAWWERLTRGFVGCAAAIFGHPIGGRLLGAGLDVALPDKWMPPQPDLDVSAGFLIGLVGMIACQAALNMVTVVKDKAEDIVDDYIGEHAGAAAKPRRWRTIFGPFEGRSPSIPPKIRSFLGRGP